MGIEQDELSELAEAIAATKEPAPPKPKRSKKDLAMMKHAVITPKKSGKVTVTKKVNPAQKL